MVGILTGCDSLVVYFSFYLVVSSLLKKGNKEPKIPSHATPSHTTPSHATPSHASAVRSPPLGEGG